MRSTVHCQRGASFRFWVQAWLKSRTSDLLSTKHEDNLRSAILLALLGIPPTFPFLSSSSVCRSVVQTGWLQQTHLLWGDLWKPLQECPFVFLEFFLMTKMFEVIAKLAGVVHFESSTSIPIRLVDCFCLFSLCCEFHPNFFFLIFCVFKHFCRAKTRKEKMLMDLVSIIQLTAMQWVPLADPGLWSRGPSGVLTPGDP